MNNYDFFMLACDNRTHKHKCLSSEEEEYVIVKEGVFSGFCFVIADSFRDF